MFSIGIFTTSPTGRSRRSFDLWGVGRWTSRRLSKVQHDVSTPGLLELAECLWPQAHISFSKAAKVAFWIAGVEAFLTSISVPLEKRRSQYVMLMMWRKKWEISGTNASPPCFDELWNRQSYSILHNITQYYSKVNLHIDVQDEIQLFHCRDIEHRKDIWIGWNRPFVPGPKEPIAIHLSFGVIIILSTSHRQWVRGLHND